MRIADRIFRLPAPIAHGLMEDTSRFAEEDAEAQTLGEARELL